jgi:glutathione synthase/RimK-type ligase-like ATP-grasp enzyme
MMPGVPLAGWDVALTNKGMVLLEANLSCNFFRGSFDKEAYFSFVDDYFLDLAEKQQQKH